MEPNQYEVSRRNGVESSQKIAKAQSSSIENVANVVLSAFVAKEKTMSSSANVEATMILGPYNLPLSKTGPKKVTLKDKYGAIVEIVVDHKRSFRAVRIVGVIIEDIGE